MAEGLLKNILKGRDNIRVISAGTSVFPGARSSPDTIEVMKREGIDVAGHSPQGITKNMIEEADIILVMERRHRDTILRNVPHVKGKVYLLAEYGRPGKERRLVNPDIPDPIGKSIEIHRECLGIIKEGVRRVAKKLTEGNK